MSEHLKRTVHRSDYDEICLSYWQRVQTREHGITGAFVPDVIFSIR